jgi:peptidoglycan/xylan/chitin deacetylase (PgdA/CDA1 family)
MYHRFSRRPAWRRTDLPAFEDQIRFLTRNYRLRSLDEVVDRLTLGEKIRPDEVVVTVDDAYADFYELALPVLERHRVPVALYVPTDFVDQREWLWPDRLLWLVQATTRDSVPYGDRDTLTLATLSDRRNAWNVLADDLLEMSKSQRDEAFAALEAVLGVVTPSEPADGFRAMTWDQVRDAARRGVLIGSQATAHIPLARESVTAQLEFARASRRRLEDELGCAVRHFSYPHGRLRDFDDNAMRAARDAGFCSSAAAVADSVHHGRVTLYALPRISPSRDVADLRAELSGLAHLREWTWS